jgi:protease I
MSRVAMIVDEMFEDSEVRIPRDKLEQSGHEVIAVGRRAGATVSGKNKQESVETKVAASEASVDDFDALLIPGGYSPDRLRTDPKAVAFTRAFFDRNKPVAAVCHAPSLLIEADVTEGRTLTSWPSIRTDLINAGATWVDREVVEDENLITSRKPDDLEAFSAAFIRQLQSLEDRPRARTESSASPSEQRR